MLRRWILFVFGTANLLTIEGHLAIIGRRDFIRQLAEVSPQGKFPIFFVIFAIFVILLIVRTHNRMVLRPVCLTAVREAALSNKSQRNFCNLSWDGLRWEVPVIAHQ
jgi:hypothetical protein